MTDLPESLKRRMIECPACHGEGKAYYGDNTGYVKCWNPLCNGTGKVPEPAEDWALRNAAIAMCLAKQPPLCDYCGDARKICISMGSCREARLTAALVAVERKEQNNDQHR